MITEASIRARLAEDKEKPSRLATWEEVEHLLHLLDDHREALREAGADLRLMEQKLADAEFENRRMGWL